MAEEQKSTAMVQFSLNNRQALLQRLGVTDDGSLNLTKVIKTYLESQGMKGKELKEETNRILRGETVQNHIDAEIGTAQRAGWGREIRYGKASAKDGKTRSFVVTYREPASAKVKAISKSQEEKIMELVGGRDSALGRQILENLAKGKMLSESKVKDVDATVTPVPEPEPTPAAS